MATKKQKKQTYYRAEADPWNSGVQEGRNISVRRNMYYEGEKADFKPFLTVPMKELEKQLKASQAEEKKVFERLYEAAKAWDEHGAQSLLLQKAIEYLKVPEVKHTNNEWKKRKDGSWEISNLVYKMTFSITRSGMEWKLVWEVSYMAPSLQGYRGYERTPRERIDYEGSKKYKTLDGAQKYVQLKFDQYSSYFKELSPPVPIAAKDLFCVNGQLLQGYKLGRPQPKKEEIPLSDLLACLEDEDITSPKPEKPLTPAPEVQPGSTKEQDKAPPTPKPDKAKKSAKKKKPAPSR